MPMLRVTGLGDGTPASTTSTTGSGLNLSTLPTDIWTGVTSWMPPFEAVTTLKETFSGNMPSTRVLIGTALVPILALSLLAGKRRGFF